MKKMLSVVLTLSLCLSLLAACGPAQPAPIPDVSQQASAPAEQKPEASSGNSEKEEQVLSGKTLDSVGLDAILPDGVRYYDINVDIEENEGFEDFYRNVSVGQYTINMNVLDGAIMVNELTVLNVNAYNWNEGTPEQYKYRIVGISKDAVKTYDEIEPYIIYKDSNRLVIETSYFLGKDTRAEMEKYIEENTGKGPAKNALGDIIGPIYNNGTYYYDYSWLPEAFDMIVENKYKLILPKEQIDRPIPYDDPDVLGFNDIHEIGLTATFPDGIKFNDINYENGNAIPFYENVSARGCTLGMCIADKYGSTYLELMTVHGYEWNKGSAQDYRYTIPFVATKNALLTYDEIEPYILYEDEHRIVVETSAINDSDFSLLMKEYIEENKNVKSDRTFANGTNIYDYSWLDSAVKLVNENKNKIIVPIENH